MKAAHSVLETALKEVLQHSVGHNWVSFFLLVFMYFLAASQQSTSFKTRGHNRGKGSM